ncbi:pyridoxal phosphate-dependent transferase [Lanmaoa asiatica]|nr:pyridoxal phosphate-dependent transferase [Lanmaoa asiatica]
MSLPGLAFRLSRGVLTTIQPPIPSAKAWGLAYPSTPARPLLDMSQGVPGSPPLDVLLDALAKTSSSFQSSGYGPALGEPKMRAAFAQEMKTVYGKNADITAEDVAITAGCNMAFIATVMCLADAGDEVILPVPWYFNHSYDVFRLLSPVPLYTRSDRGFLPSIDECKKLITSKTKAIALTGAIYSPALIAQFADLARENNIALVVDETYRDFVEHFPPHDLFSPTQTEILHPSWSWRIERYPPFLVLQIVCHSWAPFALLDPRNWLSQTQSLLSELRSSILSNAKTLKARHELFRRSLPSEWTIGSQGGYYAFVKHPFQNVSSITFCERLAKELGIVVLPARFFYSEADETLGLSEEGWDRWVRFSVANVGDEQIVQVCERLRECNTHFE